MKTYYNIGTYPLREKVAGTSGTLQKWVDFSTSRKVDFFRRVYLRVFYVENTWIRPDFDHGPKLDAKLCENPDSGSKESRFSHDFASSFEPVWKWSKKVDIFTWFATILGPLLDWSKTGHKVTWKTWLFGTTSDWSKTGPEKPCFSQNIASSYGPLRLV